MQQFIAYLCLEGLILLSRPDSVETQNKETKNSSCQKKVQNASDFKVFLDFEVFEAYLADDVICFVSFLDQKMLDKVTVKVSL